jgi:glycosyltransferase involved in cell wall biosynthesis
MIQSDDILKPFFSVIIPVYNKEKYISMTINSVLDQEFKNFELIIVCDPSTDNSNIEVGKFRNHKQVRILHREKAGHGGYAARNLGIKSARAEWIAFLDADDEWYSDHLLNLYNVINKSDKQIFTTGWYDSYGNNYISKAAFVKQNESKGIFEINFNDYINNSIKGATPIHTNTIVVKKELFDKVTLFPESICKRGGDVTTWMQLVKYTNSLVCLPTITSIYHRENSTVTQELLPELKGNCILLITEKILKEENKKDTILLLKKFSNYHIRYGLIARIKLGTLKYSDVKYHNFKTDKLFHIFFIICSFMPGFIQKNIFKIARVVKK